jgi:hypothetical protein
VARSSQHLRAALGELNEELRELDARREMVQTAISGIEKLINSEAKQDAAPASQARETAITDEPPTPASANGATATPPRRPLLRDSIPVILREHPEGLTLKELTEELWRREWIGGKTEGSRAETVRQGLAGLRRNGVIASEIPPGEKAARLSNVMLPRAPAYSHEEEEHGI